MLIKEVRIRDFLVVPGDQAITLPTEGESNLVVILAPDASPTCILGGSEGMPTQPLQQRPGHALVHQDLHRRAFCTVSRSPPSTPPRRPPG